MREIISCSRRTDIPAFYYPWLQECLKNGYAMVQNPYTRKNHMVDLTPEKIHSICLWSKSFANVIKDPGYLASYPLYFQFTVTGYNEALEPNVVRTEEALRQMEQLAYRYSPQQINWRFDPIILCAEGEKSRRADPAEKTRLMMFERLCREISAFGMDRCTVSFLYLYDKVKRRLRTAKLLPSIPSAEGQIRILQAMAEIAAAYHITIYTCASPLLEAVLGVKKGHCIDGEYLAKLFGPKASRAKDTGQRKECGCTKSRDIGAYSGQPCLHGCLYCYANTEYMCKE